MKSLRFFPAAILLVAPVASQAVNVTFTLTGANTSTLNSVNLNVPVLGAVTATQQSAGSLGPRAISGSITVNVDSLTAPTSIQFISATLNPAEFGTVLLPGSSPGEYGFQATLVGTENGAWRNSLTTLSSGIIPLGAGSFNAVGVLFHPTAGTLDYAGTAATGTANLSDLPAAANTGVTLGSYSVAGGTATLSLAGFDIIYNAIFPTVVGDATAAIRFTGSLTGTAAVPEPSMAGLLLGAGTLLLRRRRK